MVALFKHMNNIPLCESLSVICYVFEEVVTVATLSHLHNMFFFQKMIKRAVLIG